MDRMWARTSLTDQERSSINKALEELIYSDRKRNKCAISILHCIYHRLCERSRPATYKEIYEIVEKCMKWGVDKWFSCMV